MKYNSQKQSQFKTPNHPTTAAEATLATYDLQSHKSYYLKGHQKPQGKFVNILVFDIRIILKVNLIRILLEIEYLNFLFFHKLLKKMYILGVTFLYGSRATPNSTAPNLGIIA
jgi:predicted ferric reductase